MPSLRRPTNAPPNCWRPRFTHVTIDLALGERDGIELLRLLSELKIIPRVIVISGCDERILNSAVRLAQAAGACDAISLAKPMNSRRCAWR